MKKVTLLLSIPFPLFPSAQQRERGEYFFPERKVLTVVAHVKRFAKTSTVIWDEDIKGAEMTLL